MSENKNMPELSMDEMDHVSGGVDGIPEKNGTIGTVVAALGNGMYEVDIGGQTVAVRISGKLRMNYIRILSATG